MLHYGCIRCKLSSYPPVLYLNYDLLCNNDMWLFFSEQYMGKGKLRRGSLGMRRECFQTHGEKWPPLAIWCALKLEHLETFSS